LFAERSGEKLCPQGLKGHSDQRSAFSNQPAVVSCEDFHLSPVDLPIALSLIAES
jgi:hypothetical protein